MTVNIFIVLLFLFITAVDADNISKLGIRDKDDDTAFLEIYNNYRNLNNKTYSGSSSSQDNSRFYDYDSNYNYNINELLRYNNPYHINVAQNNGVKILGLKTLKKLVKAGKLVRINSCDTYIIGKLTSSHPFVVPQMKDLLNEIGHEFHVVLKNSKMPYHRFYISSCSRTLAEQKRLLRTNPNAGKKSSHCYGLTIDVSYIRFSEGFNGPAPSDGIIRNEYFLSKQKTPEKILAAVLVKLQREKKCIVIYEKYQSVFHITVLPAAYK